MYGASSWPTRAFRSPTRSSWRRSGAPYCCAGPSAASASARAAVADARATKGVVDVYDELHVRLLDDDRRADAELRGEALQRIVSDPRLPVDYLDVHVRDGWITLKGEVDEQFQSDAAFEHVADLGGVAGVTNTIKVIQPR